MFASCRLDQELTRQTAECAGLARPAAGGGDQRPSNGMMMRGVSWRGTPADVHRWMFRVFRGPETDHPLWNFTDRRSGRDKSFTELNESI